MVEAAHVLVALGIVKAKEALQEVDGRTATGIKGSAADFTHGTAIGTPQRSTVFHSESRHAVGKQPAHHKLRIAFIVLGELYLDIT